MSSASRPNEDVSILVGVEEAAAEEEAIACGFPEVWLGRANSAVLGMDCTKKESAAEDFVLVPVGVARRGTNAIASQAAAAAAAAMKVAGRRILTSVYYLNEPVVFSVGALEASWPRFHFCFGFGAPLSSWFVVVKVEASTLWPIS